LCCLSLPWPFRYEAPRSRGLDFLGFPWILSSESRLFNGLHGIERGKFFLAVLPWHSQRRNGSLRSRPCGSAGLLMGRAKPDFCFSAIDCRPSRSLSASSIQSHFTV